MEKSYLRLEQRAIESLEPYIRQERFDKVLEELSNYYEAITNDFFYSLFESKEKGNGLRKRVGRKLSKSKRAYNRKNGEWKLVENAGEYAENLRERIEEHREEVKERRRITEVDKEKYSEMDRHLTESWKDLAKHLEPRKQLLFDRNGNLVDRNGNGEYSIYEIQTNILEFFERVF